jgi:hypothetical protein
MRIYRADVPLGETSEPEEVSNSSDKNTKSKSASEVSKLTKNKSKEDDSDVKVTDIGTALSDITKRAAARQAAKAAANKKVRDDIAERRASAGKTQTGTGKLIGLKGLGDYGK